MPRIIYRHQPATRFIVSAIGEPGQREFFIQVKSEGNLNTVAIDKGQVIALSGRFQELIRELRRGRLATTEDLTAPAVQDDAPLELPIESDFTVGIISITWENEYVIVNIQAASQDDELLIDDIDSGPDLIVASLKINQIKGFCDRANLVVNAGRPACPFCALPVDPLGHLCPRANGYRR
ncbi:MAG: DUF3090 family protein [Actinobacteria bacterium]|nr:DUF3090 family protein [Actinomycetota bacterium]